MTMLIVLAFARHVSGKAGAMVFPRVCGACGLTPVNHFVWLTEQECVPLVFLVPTAGFGACGQQEGVHVERKESVKLVRPKYDRDCMGFGPKISGYV